MRTLDSFLRQLRRLEWSPTGYLDPQVLTLLGELGVSRTVISRAVTSWADGLEVRQLRCHDTATHYKWFVHCHERRGYKVWLHQYKSHHERRTGFAEVPHNHRYSLASIILRGGFLHHTYDRSGPSLVEFQQARRELRQGDVYSVHWGEIHRLSELADSTLTLVVESPPVAHYSEAFYDSGHPRIFKDFVGLHSRLVTDVQAL